MVVPKKGSVLTARVRTSLMTPISFTCVFTSTSRERKSAELHVRPSAAHVDVQLSPSMWWMVHRPAVGGGGGGGATGARPGAHGGAPGGAYFSVHQQTRFIPVVDARPSVVADEYSRLQFGAGSAGARTAHLNGPFSSNTMRGAKAQSVSVL